jgi:D-lactate dehydrogenase (cytochrome)
LAFIEEICNDNGSVFIDKGIGLDERNRLWEMRHLVFESIKRQNFGLLPLIMDVAVPLSSYSDMVAFVRQEVSGLLAYVFGHAGDGNIHVIVMDIPSDKSRWAKVDEAHRRIVEQALAFEGTCTGEHGIGIGKRQFAVNEHKEGIDLMRKIKNLIDPAGLFNPGKIFL